MKLSFLYEQIVRENFKSQKQRFIQQGIDPQIVRDYFEKFKHIKEKKYKELTDEIKGVSVPADRRNDIDAYKNFHELERVVDYVGGQRSVTTAMKGEDIEVDGKPVYEDDNFEVYYADSPRACIKYKGKMPYSWCVARSDSSNMFYTYRFKPYEPAFYFVKDKKATDDEFKLINMGKSLVSGEFRNKYHFFVIQVPKNIDMSNAEQEQYIVTSAKNDGDEQMSWEQILKINPKLNAIREVLEPKPFTDEERSQHKRFKNGIDDSEFEKLSYEDKRTYLDIYPTIGRPISERQLKALPKDLLNLYVSFGIGLTSEQHEYVATMPKILKRYKQITLRKYEEYMSKENYQRWQLKLNFSEARMLPDEKLELYIDSLSRDKLNEFLHDGGWEAIEYLKEHLGKKLDDDGKSIINLVHEIGEEKSLNKLNEMLPDGVSIRPLGNNDVLFEMDDFVSDGFWRTFRVGDDIEWIYEAGGVSPNTYDYYDYHSYFDGYDEGIEREFNHHLDNIITNESSLMEDLKSVGIEADKVSIVDLLDSYGDVDEIKNMIDTEWTEAASNAQEIAADKINAKMGKIIEVKDHYNEVTINHKALVIFLHHHELFTNDSDDFISNMINLFEEILSDFGLPSDYYSAEEMVRDDEHEYMEVNETYIYDRMAENIESALEKFIDENHEDEEDVEYGDSRLAKLKSEVIGLLNKTLKALGQDPNAVHIENELVEINIDRSKFKLDGSVYVDVYDKQHKKHHQGYVKIKDLPTYFQNFKLFETLQRFNQLIK
jgi:hypothetical protein